MNGAARATRTLRIVDYPTAYCSIIAPLRERPTGGALHAGTGAPAAYHRLPTFGTTRHPAPFAEGVSEMTRGSRRGLAMLAATIVATVVALVPMSPALAADGDDPTWYGCDSGAVRLRTAQMPNRQLRMVDPANGQQIGYAYLVYSSQCETQWVKVNYNSGYYPQPSVWRRNQSDAN